MNTKQPQFPILVKVGSCTVKIYCDPKPQGTYYRVVYYLGGKRHRIHCRDLDTATEEASKKAKLLSQGEVDVLQLTGRDRLIYGTALEAVKKSGVRLDAAALEYSEARDLLNGVPLVDAARFYARHHARGLKQKEIAEAVAEMIAEKNSAGLSARYLEDLRYRLGTFAARFHCNLASLTADDVREFVADLRKGTSAMKQSVRSHNNFVGALKTFFAFAQDRSWLAKETDLLASTKRRKEKATPVEIFTPAEMRSLLAEATPEMAVCLALGGFAGLRSEEILRLEWADLERSPGFVVVGADKAKTATRRLVPISDNLSRWLAVVPQGKGRIWKDTKAMFFKMRLAVASEARVKWKQNALRHSWISYRLAEIQNVNQIALEAGNSPQMIFRHYRELATPAQAKSWFTIAPNEAKNVVPMRHGLAQSFAIPC